MESRNRLLIVLLACAGASGVFLASAAPPPAMRQIQGVACQTPPPLHCPDKDCPSMLVVEQGALTEAKTGRKFFLDYPCDLKPGEKVTFILALHGAGSYGNWQRNYFPLMDYVDKYRLVVATPNSPTRIWSPGDDEYLQNIVNMVYSEFGKQNIKAFWLVGHSQGGMTSNRLLRTDFFKNRVDGWLSLSGGRLGPTPPIPPSFFQAARPAAPTATADGSTANPAASGATPAAAPPPPSAATLSAARAALKEPPDNDFSFIFETGEHELGDQPIPDASPWAAKYGCGPRERLADVVDTRSGYVYDSTRQNPGSDAWGHLPRPGTAEVFVYPNCKGGRVVADVVRMGKGHTEGLEPAVTEKLIQLMLSATK